MSRKTWSAVALALLVSGGTSLAALAESVWVQNENVNILGGKGSVYGTVTTVKKGQELQVVSRDGRWVQVQVPGGQSGWVNESALAARKVNADLFSGINREGAGLNTAAASRGLDPSTEQYAATKGMSKAPLERLISIKKSIQPAEWEAFNRAVLAAAGMPAPAASPMAPQTPVISPGAPGYSPQGQNPYAPQAPAYSPQQPTYAPQNPGAAPQGPMTPGGPQRPSYTPQQPGVQPGQPPRAPSYTPQQQPFTPQQPPRQPGAPR